MQVKDTRTYVPELKRLVQTYNSIREWRLTTCTGYWGTQGTAAHHQERTKARSYPPLTVGDTVRLGERSPDAPVMKPQYRWSKDLHRVLRIQPPVAEYKSALYSLDNGRTVSRSLLHSLNETETQAD